MTTKLFDNTVARYHPSQKIAAGSILISLAQLFRCAMLSQLIVKTEKHEFYKEVQRSKRISKIRAWHNPDVTTR